MTGGAPVFTSTVNFVTVPWHLLPPPHNPPRDICSRFPHLLKLSFVFFPNCKPFLPGPQWKVSRQRNKASVHAWNSASSCSRPSTVNLPLFQVYHSKDMDTLPSDFPGGNYVQRITVANKDLVTFSYSVRCTSCKHQKRSSKILRTVFGGPSCRIV